MSDQDETPVPRIKWAEGAEPKLKPGANFETHDFNEALREPSIVRIMPSGWVEVTHSDLSVSHYPSWTITRIDGEVCD